MKTSVGSEQATRYRTSQFKGCYSRRCSLGLTKSIGNCNRTRDTSGEVRVEAKVKLNYSFKAKECQGVEMDQGTGKRLHRSYLFLASFQQMTNFLLEMIPQ